MSRIQHPSTIDLSSELSHGFAASFIRYKATRLVGRAGIRPCDQEDVEQELRLHLVQRFPKFDPARAVREIPKVSATIAADAQSVSGIRVSPLRVARHRSNRRRTSSTRAGSSSVCLVPMGHPPQCSVSAGHDTIPLKITHTRSPKGYGYCIVEPHNPIARFSASFDIGQHGNHLPLTEVGGTRSGCQGGSCRTFSSLSSFSDWCGIMMQQTKKPRQSTGRALWSCLSGRATLPSAVATCPP